ncbi:MAG: hypothetical protein KDK76_04655 [Chlamydiia bacterium]|nr:hypothetical protein [Chlamydiia bacterium]
MPSVHCGPLPSSIYDNYFKPSIDEARNQLYHAWIPDSSGASLGDRLLHLIEGTILLLPLVNVIAFRIFEHFGMTIAQDFENSVRRGEVEKVRRYLDNGADANGSDVHGTPLIDLASSRDMIDLLLSRGARIDRQGPVFLGTLIRNGHDEFARQIVQEERVNINSYLTSDVFRGSLDHEGYRTFLLQMGYRASIEERQGRTYTLKTALPLERMIMTGDVDQIKALGQRAESITQLERDLETLRGELPRLYTSWIWDHILEGYCTSNEGDLSEELICQILRKKEDRNAHVGDRPILFYLLDKGKEEFVHQLIRDGLIDLTPYQDPEAFDRSYDLFLIQIGNTLPPEQRAGQIAFVAKTELPLEEAIVMGNINGVKAFLQGGQTLEALDEQLQQIKVALPHLNTDWIWQYVFEGYCQGANVDNEVAIQLLNRGGKVEGLLSFYRLQDMNQLIPHLVNVAGKEPLAKALVEGNFLSVAPFFTNQYLVVNRQNRKTNHSAQMVHFLIKMGYDQILRSYYHGQYPDDHLINPLEKVIMDCKVVTDFNGQGLKQLAQEQGLSQIIAWYDELKQKEHYPRLNAVWIWEILGEAFWEVNQYDELRSLVNQDLFAPSHQFFQSKITAPGLQGRKCLVDIGYRGAPIIQADELPEDSMERIVYSKDANGLRDFARNLDLETFYVMFNEILGNAPKMDTRWMWDVFFQVPRSHYQGYREIEGIEDLEPPPGDIQIEELETLYDNHLNFDQLSRLSKTLEGQVYSKGQLRVGVTNIISGINTGHIVYRMSEEDRAKHRIQIKWIIHYLKEAKENELHIPKEKGEILVDMLKECLVCHSRWHEVFDAARKRLGDLEVKVSSFEDQLHIVFGGRRSLVIETITQRNGGLGTHYHDGLVKYLKESRALPNPPVTEDFYWGFNSDQAHQYFDAEYTPGEMIEALLDHIRGHEDFYNLLTGKLGVQVAPQYKRENYEGLRLLLAEKGDEAHLPFRVLAAAGIEDIERDQPSAEEFFPFLQTLNWGRFVTFPADLQNQVEDIEEAIKTEKTNRFIAKWKEHVKDYDPEKEYAKMAVFTGCNQNPVCLNKQQMSQEFRGSGSATLKEVAAKLSPHLICAQEATLEAFYQAHPEIPDELKKEDLNARNLNDDDVKAHLMELAYSLRYDVARASLKKLVEDKIAQDFNRVIRPMKETDEGAEVPVLKDKVHPLILGKLLIDLRHLEPRIPAFFNGAFTSN